MKRNLLLLSNSTTFKNSLSIDIANGVDPQKREKQYLVWSEGLMKEFLGEEKKTVLFIPYAGMGKPDMSVEDSKKYYKVWDAYEEKVKAVYNKIGHDLISIHKYEDPIKAVKEAEAIAVGGGNTFHLVHMLHKNAIVQPIKEAIENGIPYMGWSAGSNVASPSLKTTNDMPIIEPASFDCLDLIPFQINPHFTDKVLEDHCGETREDRIREYLYKSPKSTVIGLREASLLHVVDDKMMLKGKFDMVVFEYGKERVNYKVNTDVSQFL